ncbi:hypothetical protein AOQ84DRAFT_360670 [Glonium stellatum]|uniref:Uncharacterized protein n=1 Tax=Glonium stellatum TaxID=574774 RepID=A0A8E2F897_9PEZI|nr:hypothetical protein AOQ84DRAFT_360670 [Glonium stellatum]
MNPPFPSSSDFAHKPYSDFTGPIHHLPHVEFREIDHLVATNALPNPHDTQILSRTFEKTTYAFDAVCIKNFLCDNRHFFGLVRHWVEFEADGKAVDKTAFFAFVTPKFHAALKAWMGRNPNIVVSKGANEVGHRRWFERAVECLESYRR